MPFLPKTCKRCHKNYVGAGTNEKDELCPRCVEDIERKYAKMVDALKARVTWLDKMLDSLQGRGGIKWK